MIYDLALFEQLNEEYRARPIVDIAKIRQRRALLSAGQEIPNADKPQQITPEQKRAAATGQLKPVLNDINLCGKVVLELGCAHGWMTSVLPEHAGVARAIGVDVERYEGWEAHTDSRVSFIVADLSQDCVMPPNSIDTIISSATFEHVERPIQMLSTLYNVLREGGGAWLRMNIYTAANASHRYTEVFFPWPHLLFGDDVCEQYYEKHHKRPVQRFSWVNRMTVAHYVQIARDLGFQITLARRQVRPIDVPFYLRFFDQLGRYAALDLETNFLTLVLRKGPAGSESEVSGSRVFQAKPLDVDYVARQRHLDKAIARLGHSTTSYTN